VTGQIRPSWPRERRSYRRQLAHQEAGVVNFYETDPTTLNPRDHNIALRPAAPLPIRGFSAMINRCQRSPTDSL
jgi:hypothetical protein